MNDRQRASYDTAAAHAYLVLARADTAEALRRFESLPDTLCFRCFRLDRLTRAQLLVSAGRYKDAERILLEWRGLELVPSEVLVTFEHARVLDRLNRREEAIAAYRFVADAWAKADPELQPHVTEARAALRRLGANRTPPMRTR